MARWILRLGLALGAAGWLAGGAAFAQDARYFQGTRSSANVYVAPVASSIQKVAVMPFKAPTELIGSSVSDIFVTEMLRARRYTLVEREQIAQVLGETEFALAGLTDSAAIAAGRMLGADSVILGTVDEYGTVAHRGRSYPVVGASIRLIDCDSGQAMWSVGHARRADSPVDTLSGHARKVVHEMVAAVVQNWRVQRVVATERRSSSAPRDNPDDPVGFSGPVVMAVAVPPPPPEGLTTDDFGLRAVTLRWPPPADRSLSYRVERAEGPDGPFAPLATVAATRGAYTDVGSRGVPLNDATAYYYRLVALDRMRAESDPSAVAESLTAPPPDPSENVAAEAPAGRMARLTWEPAAAVPAEILTANYLRYLLFNHVQVQGQQLVDDAPALHQSGLQTRLDQWLDAYQDTIRDDLETRFPGDARDQFEEYIHCFTRAEQGNDLAYLEQLADAVGWSGSAAEGYGAFRRWGIDRWVAGDMQNGVDFLATLSRTIDHLEDTPALPPPRPANPLRDAEAEPAPFEAIDAPAGAPLQQFSAMREQRRQKALEDADAGMAQIAAERDAWEQEYAANKEAKAQAEAQAMQAQAARLAAINVVAGVASSTVGAFTGAIAGRAADEAVYAIFDRK